jgi:DNA helicase-2/ATP-dependent DNA helicase PcrA
MTEEAADPRELILNAQSHVLVLGGAGSGKTTVALRKAVRRIESGLLPGQSVLFLSFSRAAVARISDASKTEAPVDKRGQLHVQTFHSFCWSLLKSYGYLLGAPKKTKILLPQDEKALSNGAEPNTPEWTAWKVERERLFHVEGKLVFDLFAPKAAELLARSSLIRNSVAERYPLIIVDEAQDTGPEAWQCIEILAPLVQIICLADLDQQIFDHLPGIGPERISRIEEVLKPLRVDLGEENNRSVGTEIALFANDILGTRVRGAQYNGVDILNYNPKNIDWAMLLRMALGMSRSAIEKSTGKKSESCAILAPSGSSVARITAALSSGSNPIPHKVLFDEAEVLLASRLAAFLLEPKTASSFNSDVAIGVELLATVRRVGGSNAAIQDAAKYMSWAEQVRSGKQPKCKLVSDMQSLMHSAGRLDLCGDPAKDWLLIKQVLRSANDPSITIIAAHLDLLVAFKRGRRISASLSAMWSEFRCYPKARQALESALIEDQILAGVDDLSGIHVMTIHKSKGKQFDGVIILREGRRMSANGWTSSFVWRGDQSPYMRSRKILRVAITRARRHVLFLNPVYPTCPILSPHKLS